MALIKESSTNVNPPNSPNREDNESTSSISTNGLPIGITQPQFYTNHQYMCIQMRVKLELSKCHGNEKQIVA